MIYDLDNSVLGDFNRIEAQYIDNIIKVFYLKLLNLQLEEWHFS